MKREEVNYSAKTTRHLQQVLSLYYEKGMKASAISRKIKVSPNTIRKWILNFEAGKYKTAYEVKVKGKEPAPMTGKSLEEINAELLKRVAELESALRYEQMRSDAYNTMIDIAEERFNIEIRKKRGAKR